jgi:hypothetical protein
LALRSVKKIAAFKVMEKGRFNDLMLRFPNWMSEGADAQVYTFFGEHYSRSVNGMMDQELGDYWLEDTGQELIIELEDTGKRYAITEQLDGDVPRLLFTPADASGTEVLFLIPKNRVAKIA